ncbi:unnamed protein product [Cylindrotheca closterium]|uniref:Uncharacterized protein n=1 Tax=Cylindrotheca closterium TaxID=2856 RepID=A0AAD2CJD7_9STRA|nr:unnamed protein product [Cylindrotheca closterium]
MVFHKQRQRLSKKLAQVQKAGKEALGKASAKANEITKDKNKRPTTIFVPSSGEGHETTSPLDGMTQSANAFITQLGTNLLLGMEGISQYDCQTESYSRDESTGTTTTKIVTRLKSTGETVASHTQVQETDGSMMVVTKQSLNETSKGPLGAGIISQHDNSSRPPELPKEGIVEYTMYWDVKDTSKHRVVCKVESGPEAGKIIEYNVMTRDGPAGKQQFYKEVRVTRHSSRRGYFLGSLSFVVLAIVIFAAMTTARVTVLDCLCMPTPPNWSFSSTKNENSQWEAPWWAPLSYKTKTFRILCTTPSDHPQHAIARFALSWNSQGRQQKLGIFRLTDHYDRHDGTYTKTTSQAVHKKTGALDSVVVRTAEVEIFPSKKKNKKVESKTILTIWRAAGRNQ